ncbi:MAG: hypothetical protein GPOALKHO_000838 [Sodalis sp.]|nr:MAG: hypothetical protein GPOALKHO_000838 [Sodalis sp.]
MTTLLNDVVVQASLPYIGASWHIVVISLSLYQFLAAAIRPFMLFCDWRYCRWSSDKQKFPFEPRDFCMQAEILLIRKLHQQLFADPPRIALLKQIRATGSPSVQGAKLAGVSCKGLGCHQRHGLIGGTGAGSVRNRRQRAAALR